MTSGVAKRGRSQAKTGAGIAGLDDELITAYRRARITQVEIAERLGVSRETVRKALKARGIKQDRGKGPTAATGPSDGPIAAERTDQGHDTSDRIATAIHGTLDTELQDIERYSEGLKNYVQNLQALWRQLQGAAADVFIAEKEGRLPRMSPKTIGQLARVLGAMGPNPVEHWERVILPLQTALTAADSTDILRVEVMTPEDVAAMRRAQEKADNQ